MYQPVLTLDQSLAYAKAFDLCWEFTFGFRTFAGIESGVCLPAGDVWEATKKAVRENWQFEPGEEDRVHPEYIETILNRKVSGGSSAWSVGDVKLSLDIVSEMDYLRFAAHVDGAATSRVVRSKKRLIQLLHVIESV